jgi:hypothetical protein
VRQSKRRKQPPPDTTTLHWAALLSLPEICSWLISQGSDVNRISKMGSPLDCALLQTIALMRLEENILVDFMNLMDFKRGGKNAEDIEYISFTVLQLIQGGAKLDKATTPSCPVLPLEIALITQPHSSDVVNHFLDGGASITEHALEIVDNYLNRKPTMVSVEGIPSGMAAIFSKTASINVSDAA